VDSLTQAVLGAAVGEAVGGTKLGRRAALWGAVAGTLPDLDLLAYPLLDPAGELYFHRGITHALVFAPVVAPLLGAALARLYRARGEPGGRPGGSWRDWTLVCFWALWTHPLLDWFTVYGTQLFRPFSDYPAARGSVFIIDPLYTVPLLVALAVALGWRARRRAVWVGLALSTAYLGWSLVAQGLARAAVERSLAAQGVRAEHVLVTPAPLTTLLWTATVDAGDHFLVGSRSLLDGARPVRFAGVPKHAGRLAPYRGTRGLDVLEWFSRGWLAVVGEVDGEPVVADLRFGRADGRLRGSAAGYVFAWRLVRTPGGDATIAQIPVEARLPPGFLARLLDRIAGREPPAASGVPSAPPAPAPRPRAAPP
jgi:inner membrane protein